MRFSPFIIILFFATLLRANEPKISVINKPSNLMFTTNKGQWDGDFQFMSFIPDGSLFLTADALKFQFFSKKDYHAITQDNPHAGPYYVQKKLKRHNYSMRFIGANAMHWDGVKKVSGYANYLKGSDKSNWVTNVYSYQELQSENLYKGVDLKLYAQDERIKYDLVIAPGINPNIIKWKYTGADEVQLKKGEIRIKTSVNLSIELEPYAYQEVEGQKRTIPCEFVESNGVFSYFFPEGFNSKFPLVIDPEVVFSTYSGSSANNFGMTATYDKNGYLYAGGIVFGPGYETTEGAYSETFAGSDTMLVDLGITKYDTTGTKRIYSTYIGGTNEDVPHSLVTNSEGELYILGTTASDDFPISNGAFQSNYKGGGSYSGLTGNGIDYSNGTDVFVLKLNADGTDLLASTYIGGSGLDGISADPFLHKNYTDELRGEIILDELDQVYIVTTTNSADMPIKKYQTGTFGFDDIDKSVYRLEGQYDGYVAKLDANLSAILWSKFIGGKKNEALYSLDIKDGYVYCVGGTTSEDFYTSPGAYQDTMSIPNGKASGFVIKLNQQNGSLVASTYLGKNDEYSQSYFTKIDPRGFVYVFGQIENAGSDFNENTTYGVDNAGSYIVNLNNDLQSRNWATTFGLPNGQKNITPAAFAVGVCAKIFLTGWDFTTGLEVSPDAVQATTDGQDFYILLLDVDANELQYASYYGANGIWDHVDGGTSRFDAHGIIYQSACAGCGGSNDFPTTPGVVSNENNASCNNAVFKIDFEFDYVFADFELDNVCFPDTSVFINKSILGDEYLWDFGDGNTSTEENPKHAYDQPGVYRVKLSATNTGICNNTDILTKYIMVLGTQKNYLPEQKLCVGNQLQIGLPKHFNNLIYHWTPTDGLSNTSIANPVATPSETTTYQLTVDNGLCVDTFIQKVVVVNAHFDAPDEVYVCEPTADYHIQINRPSTDMVLEWSYDDYFNPLINNVAYDDGIDINLTQNDYIYVRSLLDGCRSEDTIPIIVDEIAMTKSQNAVLCDNESYTLFAEGTGSHNNSYLYSFSNLGVVDTVDGSVTFTVSDYGWYHIKVADVEGLCFVEDSVYLSHISIHYDVPQDTSVCYGDSLFLLANPTFIPSVISGEWYPDSIISVNNGPGIWTKPITEELTYWWTSYGTNQGCSYNDSVKVRPYDPQINVSDDEEVCYGDTITLQVENVSTDGSNFTYEWTPTNFIIGDNTGEEIKVVPLEDMYFYVTATNQGGCTVTDSVKLTFEFIGVEPSNDVFICQGDTAYLSLYGFANKGLSSSWNPASDIITDVSNDSVIGVSPSESSFYSVVVDKNGLCPNSFGFDVVVHNDQVEHSNDTIICKGDTINLEISNLYPQFPLSYIWSPSNEIIGTNNTRKIEVAPANSMTYYFEATYDPACPYIDSILVEVQEIRLSVPPYARFCEGENVIIEVLNLDGTQVLTYEWESDATIISGANSNKVTISATGDSEARLRVSNVVGCELLYTIPIYISQPKINLLGDSVLCENESFWLHAVHQNPLDTFLYTWSGANIVPPSNLDSIFITPQASGNVYVNAVNQIGCVTSDSMLVVLASDQVLLPAEKEICFGDSIWIQVSAKYPQLEVAYQWNGSDILINDVDSVLVNPDQTTSYTVTISPSVNCTYAATYNLVVKKVETAITNDTLICPGQTITLSVSNLNPTDPLTHEWLPDNGNGNNAQTYTVSPNQSENYRVISTNSLGCFHEDSVLVALADEQILLTGTDSICLGDTVLLKAINVFPQFPVTYLWDLPNAIDYFGDLTEDSLYVIPDTSFTAKLNTTSNIGCDQLDSFMVYVSEIIAGVPDTLVVCKGVETTVRAENPLGQIHNHLWSYNGQIIGQNNTDSLRFIAEQDGELFLQINNELGCTKEFRIPFSVTFVDVTADEDELICGGSTVTIGVTNNDPSQNLTYQWTPNHGIQGSSTGNAITVKPTKSTNYFVEVVNQFGCTTTDSIQVALTDDMILITPDTTICAGDLTVLRAENQFPQFAVTYQWTPESEILSDPTLDTVLVQLYADVTYTVEIITGKGCNVSTDIDVHISDLSLIDFQAVASRDSIAYGDSTVIWVEPLIGQYDYHWQPESYFEDPSMVESSVILYESTSFVATISDAFCSREAEVFIFVQELICGEPNIYIPNAFTPNKDGKNDLLFVRGNNLLAIDLKIYDRWGELVFESQDIKQGWDGTYKGEQLDPAVYVYHLTARCETNLEYFTKGNITLIR